MPKKKSKTIKRVELVDPLWIDDDSIPFATYVVGVCLIAAVVIIITALIYVPG